MRYVHHRVCLIHLRHMYEWSTVKLDANGSEEVSLLVRCPQIFKHTQEWYLARVGKVSSFHGCPQREVPLYIHV